MKNKADLDFHKSKLFETWYTPFWKSKFFFTFLGETLFALLIPNSYYGELKFSYLYENSSENVVINYIVNDILVIITIIRTILSVQYLHKFFEYNSNGSFRIIKLLGNEINTGFFIRCLFAESALSTVSLMFVSLLFIFTLII